MIKKIKKEIHTLTAAVNREWNWRTLRAVANPVQTSQVILPDAAREFMQNLGTALRGTVIVYGGALNDLSNHRSPKDYDSFILTDHHPLLAMHLAERWSKRNNFGVTHRKRRVRLLWKQLAIHTGHGAYDLTCLQAKKMSPLALTKQLADEADVSPCARSSTIDSAFESQRCRDGEERQQLIFRPLGDSRNQFRHLDRWVKYALIKYPSRPVIYQSKEDAELFEPLNNRRQEFAAQQNLLLTKTPKFDAKDLFDPILPGFYGRLLAKANATPAR